MAEWSIAAVSKTVEPSRVPRVRISPSPPHDFLARETLLSENLREPVRSDALQPLREAFEVPPIKREDLLDVTVELSKYSSEPAVVGS